MYWVSAMMKVYDLKPRDLHDITVEQFFGLVENLKTKRPTTHRELVEQRAKEMAKRGK